MYFLVILLFCAIGLFAIVYPESKGNVSYQHFFSQKNVTIYGDDGLIDFRCNNNNFDIFITFNKLIVNKNNVVFGYITNGNNTKIKYLTVFIPSQNDSRTLFIDTRIAKKLYKFVTKTQSFSIAVFDENKNIKEVIFDSKSFSKFSDRLSCFKEIIQPITIL